MIALFPITKCFVFQNMEEPFISSIQETLGDRFTENQETNMRLLYDFMQHYLTAGVEKTLKERGVLNNNEEKEEQKEEDKKEEEEDKKDNEKEDNKSDKKDSDTSSSSGESKKSDKDKPTKNGDAIVDKDDKK